jgi:hypothetical protein
MFLRKSVNVYKTHGTAMITSNPTPQEETAERIFNGYSKILKPI